MSVIDLKVTGLDAFHAQLLALGAELGAKTVAAAGRRAMQPVLAAAKARVPVHSGDLRDALQLGSAVPDQGDGLVAVGIVVSSKSARAQALKAAVKKAISTQVASRGLRVKRISVKHSSINELPPSRRWFFIELGTAKYPAHPFLRPALDEQAENTLVLLKTELAKGIARALKGGAR